MIHYDAMKPLNTSGGGGGGPQCIYDGFRHQNLKMCSQIDGAWRVSKTFSLPARLTGWPWPVGG